MKNLQRVSYEQVRRKLEPRVDEETWNAGIGMLNPTPTDAVSCRNVVFTCGEAQQVKERGVSFFFVQKESYRVSLRHDLHGSNGNWPYQVHW